MKAIILALLVVCAFAVQHRPLTNADKLKIDTLRKSGTWAGVMLGLAELHLMAQGPVDALVTGIQEVVADLERKHAQADEAFAVRTDEHNTEVRRLTDLINEANRQIADTEETLANVLRPQKQQLEESIADRERFVADTQQYVVDQTNLRELAHNAYLVRVEETQQGIAAIAEALTILSQLQDGGSSFAQVKKLNKVMEKVQLKLSKQKTVEKHFIAALVQLATSEFADGAAIQRVVDKLNEVNNNMIQALLDDGNNEEAEVAAYNTDMTEKAQAIAEAQEQLSQLNQQLDETEEAIAAAEDFIVQRQWDVTGFTAELDAENASYEEATNVYNDLVEQFNKEQDACAQALDILQNSNFAGYIGDRMQMDRVIDNQNGDGIATGAGTFDFQGSAPRMSL